jgi:hypothetical protein
MPHKYRFDGDPEDVRSLAAEMEEEAREMAAWAERREKASRHEFRALLGIHREGCDLIEVRCGCEQYCTRGDDFAMRRWPTIPAMRRIRYWITEVKKREGEK